MTTPSSHDLRSKLLDLLHLFAARQLRYIVIRSSRKLFDPSQRLPKDLDILFAAGDQARLCQILDEKNIPIIRKHGRIDAKFISKSDAIALDCQMGCIREKHICFVPFSLAEQHSKIIDGIPVLSGQVLAFHLIVHSVLAKGAFKNEYIEEIRHILDKYDSTLLAAMLRGSFGRRRTQTILQALHKQNFGFLEKQKWRHLWCHLVRNPFSVPAVGLYAWERIHARNKNRVGGGFHRFGWSGKDHCGQGGKKAPPS